METRVLERLAEAVDEVFEGGLDPRDEDAAIAGIGSLEQQVRRLQAAQVEVLDVVDRRGLYRRDGHGSAKVMVRHVAKLSGAEAAARIRSAKALRDLPHTAVAHRSGAIGTCQVRRLARAHANRRVREWLPHSDGHFVDAAQAVGYEAFAELVTDWVRRVDEDGTCHANQRNHENRDLRLVQDFDQSWHLEGGCASLQGAQLHEVLDGQVEAELLADWEKARAEHGERTLVRLAGGDPPPADPHDPHYRCGTLDGHPVEPTEAVAAALVGHVRRVVVGADSVAIDLGRDHTRSWDDHGATNPRNGAPLCGRHNRRKEHGFTAWRDPTGEWFVRRPDGVQLE